MQTIRFTQIEEQLQPGIAEVESAAIGKGTYVGKSREGDAVLQMEENNFLTINEFTWNMYDLFKPFEAETHCVYISQEALNELHQEGAFLSYSWHPTPLHKYQVTLMISGPVNPATDIVEVA